MRWHRARVAMVATRLDVMGAHVIGRRARWLGWLATACMAAAVLCMVLA